jgi:phosphatidylglycerophosphatase A
LITLPNSPSFKLLISHPAHFLSFGFGAGLAPKAPGTFGTLVALPLYFFVMMPLPQLQQLVMIAALFVLGVYVCHATGIALGVSDHGAIVWDEIVAMLLVLVFTPMTWQGWCAAFLLFRLFDIWKPFPIRQCDVAVKGGLGVMLDDILAAVYAIACLKVMVWMSW